jgi:hemerythrin-like domain-containing protein
MIATSHVSTHSHAPLTEGVDRLAATAELVGAATGAQLRTELDEVCAFLTERLLPHIDADERELYPELERLMQNRHSMTPLRREHEEIRSLILDLDERRRRVPTDRPSIGDTVALRRVLFRLYGLLKVHMAEEQLYADLVERRSPEIQAVLSAAADQAGGDQAGGDQAGGDPA